MDLEIRSILTFHHLQSHTGKKVELFWLWSRKKYTSLISCTVLYITSLVTQRSISQRIIFPKMSDRHSAAFSTLYSSSAKSQTLNCVISPDQDCFLVNPPPTLSWSWPRYVAPPALEFAAWFTKSLKNKECAHLIGLTGLSPAKDPLVTFSPSAYSLYRSFWPS